MERRIADPYRIVLDRLVECLKKNFNLVSVVVFGSVARGEARKDSDIDLLIIAENLPDRYQRFRNFDKAEECLKDLIEELEAKGYHIYFSPIIKSIEEAKRISPLYLDMVEDAVILYDRNCFFQNILSRLRKRLKELGARRVRLGNKWYWILKDKYSFGEVIEIE